MSRQEFVKWAAAAAYCSDRSFQVRSRRRRSYWTRRGRKFGARIRRGLELGGFGLPVRRAWVPVMRDFLEGGGGSEGFRFGAGGSPMPLGAEAGLGEW
jgi:hypothetical protein